MFQLVVLVVALALGATENLEADFFLFMSDYGQQYDRAQLKARYSLFKSSKKIMMAHNSQSDTSYGMVINQFSAMTPNEKSAYTGLANETEVLPVPLQASLPRGNSPSSHDNTAAGYVTRLKDQRSCGSCWAFAATAAFEGAYSRATGILKSFSEKELLDCTYEGYRDGCKGGWYDSAWRYIRNSGRFASYEDAPYDFAKDRACNYKNVIPNGIKNAEYVNYVTVGRADSDLQEAAYKAVVAVAMIVDDEFFGYGYGNYDGCKSPGKDVGHAVTLTGYTQSYWTVKNSWGRDWGLSGYVRFSRARKNICRLADYAKFPVVKKQTYNPQPDKADSKSARTRKPNHGCGWGDDYPCSDMNCNYGCDGGKCWSQCNGICGIVGSERCADCREWCQLEKSCGKHEDCFKYRHQSCAGSCTV